MHTIHLIIQNQQVKHWNRNKTVALTLFENLAHKTDTQPICYEQRQAEASSIAEIWEQILEWYPKTEVPEGYAKLIAQKQADRKAQKLGNELVATAKTYSGQVYMSKEQQRHLTYRYTDLINQLTELGVDFTKVSR